MRKIYIIRENEEDGRLLEAMDAAGMSTDESEFDNPACPRCGSSTLLAFVEAEEFEIVFWEQVDERDGAGASAWYLLCSQYDCPYQEEVERVLDPMGAEVFDQRSATVNFEENAGTDVQYPIELVKLLDYLRAVVAIGSNPKLASMLAHAERLYEQQMKYRWKWIRRVPVGARVRFTLYDPIIDEVDWDDDSDPEDLAIEGTFVAPTDEGFAVLRDPDEAMLFVRAPEIGWFQPQRPDKDVLPKKTREAIAERLASAENRSEDGKIQLIQPIGGRHWVVIRGHHLICDDVDRFGRYPVRCWNAATAHALALTPICEGYWEGRFRRSDIEARYDLKSMIKVKGHWIDVVGKIGPRIESTSPYVRTEDPIVAAALGLKEQKRGHSWSGGVSESEIEERREVRLYHWPLPDFKES